MEALANSIRFSFFSPGLFSLEPLRKKERSLGISSFKREERVQMVCEMNKMTLGIYL